MNFKDTLHGERVTLKKICPSDELAAMLFDVAPRNREDILTWMLFEESEIIPKDKIDAKRILTDIASWVQAGDAIYYAVFVNDYFIGMVLADLDKDMPQAYTGSWVDIKFRGQGYVREARLLLDNELFANGITKIISYIDIENDASIKMVTSIGYKNNGVLKNNSYREFRKEFRDEYMFSKDKPTKLLYRQMQKSDLDEWERLAKHEFLNGDFCDKAYLLKDWSDIRGWILMDESGEWLGCCFLDYTHNPWNPDGVHFLESCVFSKFQKRGFSKYLAKLRFDRTIGIQKSACIQPNNTTSIIAISKFGFKKSEIKFEIWDIYICDKDHYPQEFNNLEMDLEKIK